VTEELPHLLAWFCRAYFDPSHNFNDYESLIGNSLRLAKFFGSNERPNFESMVVRIAADL